jgi:hypothetical protein
MDKFIQNVNGNSIKIRCKIPVSGGEQVWEKLFQIQRFDYAGNEVDTGFTRLTEQEYALCRKDKLFAYFQQLGKLIVHDTLPSSAQTPHEALLDARKQIRSLQDQLQAAQKENALLKTLLGPRKAGPSKPPDPPTRKKGGKQPEQPGHDGEGQLEAAG